MLKQRVRHHWAKTGNLSSNSYKLGRKEGKQNRDVTLFLGLFANYKKNYDRTSKHSFFCFMQSKRSNLFLQRSNIANDYLGPLARKRIGFQS